MEQGSATPSVQTPPAAAVTGFPAPSLDWRAQVWKGAQDLPFLVERSASATPETTYFISNRLVLIDTFDAKPAPDGAMHWITSRDQVGGMDAAGPSPQPPASFLEGVVAKLREQGEAPGLAIFVHGLGVGCFDAYAVSYYFGVNLRDQAGYEGLVIGFDWPSYGLIESGIRYASSNAFPPGATSGTIRDNINGSVAAFRNLVAFADELRVRVPGLTVSLLCHSEGNYMAMLGCRGGLGAASFDHVLLLAADINDGAMARPDGSWIGQGSGIADSAADVTAYFSTADATLALSGIVYQQLHNPEFVARLGQVGPNYDLCEQVAGLYSVDCSDVAKPSRSTQFRVGAGEVRLAVNPHNAYLYVPEILKDMAEVCRGRPQGDIPGRRPTGNPRGYAMVPSGAAAAARP